MGVRRGEAARSSGCKAHPANAPAGSSRNTCGGDEIAGGQVEPHAARMGELLPGGHRHQGVSGDRQL